MVEPDGSRQLPERSERRRVYAPDSKISAMLRLLEKHEAPLEPAPSRRPLVAGIVIVIFVVALVFAALGFLFS